MRALALHSDVLVVSSALLQVNCVIVRGEYGEPPAHGEPDESVPAGERAETFVIDSPVLPDELDALGALLEQARFPAPSGLLATHGDWDHLLGRLAFPGVALGVAESTAARLADEPGAAQRELRAFDDELYVERPRPLALGSVQALPVPGHCAIGELELELHPADGHTVDGMAVWIPWAKVLVAGDYLSPVEIPTLAEPVAHPTAHDGDAHDAYLATLERLRPLVLQAEHVVPGHGETIHSARALEILAEDVAYLKGLRERGIEATLPSGRRSREQRRLHAENASRSSGPVA